MDNTDHVLQWLPLIRSELQAYPEAGAHGLTLSRFAAQLWDESRGGPHATSTYHKKDGSVGHARGLMQFTDDTWKDWGHGDPYDPQASIRAGIRYMTHFMKSYNDRWDEALEAYYSGPGGVLKYPNVPADIKLYATHIINREPLYRGL